MSESALHSPEPRLSWRRAVLFFIVASVIGFGSGATQAVLAQPLAPESADLAWWLSAAAYLLLVAIGYGVIWPLGTWTHGRPLRLAWALLFGVLWGLAQSQVFLTIWLWSGLLPLSAAWHGLVCWLAIAAYNGLWHGLYWDIHVSPPHNDPAWNLRKVLLVHTPNLVAGLLILGIYGLPSAWVFVAAQVLALVLSSLFMRFPAPGDLARQERSATG